MNYQRINQTYYDQNRQQYGEGDPRVLWRDRICQTKRFEKQASLFDYHQKTILDVGCGFADFYFYLLEQNMNPRSYIGIDLVEANCCIAREKLPQQASILQGDFLETEIERVDLVVLSGALNVHFDGWKKIAKAIIDKMWILSKEAITFNMRSPHGLTGVYPGKEQQQKDLDPLDWCHYAYDKTTRYSLHHDYLPYDYTIAMWKP